MAKKKDIRSGIAGAGFAASFHFEAIKKVYGTNPEVVGVFAIDAEQTGDFASQRDIQAFDSLDEM
ncbi:MAG: Gfo/Idh/MocA family oxidoreductase, partial [Planctomycetes bacterium]|nr:Gfo/Idh/MocA family oxidoreductase [Planctomycetota bacterium]